MYTYVPDKACAIRRKEVRGMRFVIVTGMSGAGKSSALKMLEDAGYFCVDNLPIPLIAKFAEIGLQEPEMMNKVALGIDIRSGEDLPQLLPMLNQLSLSGIHYEILFLDCQDSVLVKRFKETRRSHPLMKEGRIEEGLASERRQLTFLKEKATYIIDTSQLLTRELKSEIDKIFVKNENYQSFFVTVLSFGFKYGIPADADLVFDVRFLPNPYYIDELKAKTGNDKEVSDYVLKFEEAGIFLEKLVDMIEFLIPKYMNEGKNQLVIAIGCTGGKHRSVTLANAFYQRLSGHAYGIKVEHRDIDRDRRYIQH